jgi:hypothetical protein
VEERPVELLVYVGVALDPGSRKWSRKWDITDIADKRG